MRREEDVRAMVREIRGATGHPRTTSSSLPVSCHHEESTLASSVRRQQVIRLFLQRWSPELTHPGFELVLETQATAHYLSLTG